MDDTEQEEQVSQEGFPVLDTTQPVEEAQIVSQVPNSATGEDQSTILTSLDELIKAHVASIDRLKVELRKQKEMLEDGYANDPVYHEHDEQAKAANKKKSETKQQILKQPAMQTISNKAKTLAAELKDKQFSLSDYLLEYQRISGANQIEIGDGEILEIVNTARIVRKSSAK